MATSKTLTPTNVTIQIPEFTDQPDQRVNSNCIDKEADAINALNTAVANSQVFTPLFSGSTATVGEEKTLSESIFNYNFVLLTFLTNAEWKTIFVPTAFITASPTGTVFECTISASGTSGQTTYPLAYNSTIAVRFTANNKITVTASWYNNVNYVARLRDVYGVWKK